MNVNTMDRLAVAVIDCFILNNGFCLPAGNSWQTLPITPKTLRYGLDLSFFLDPDDLYRHWQSLKECRQRQNT